MLNNAQQLKIIRETGKTWNITSKNEDEVTLTRFRKENANVTHG